MTARSWPAVVCGVALVVSASACGGEPAEPRDNCGVVVDTTRYADYPTAKELIDQHLVAFGKTCGWAAFAAVTGNSVGTPCQRPSLRLVATADENPKDNPRVARLVRERRLGEFYQHAVSLLTKCEDPASGSDVLGGLRVIGQRLRDAPDRTAPSKIIIFSDLMNNKGALPLQKGGMASAGVREAKVRELRDAGLLPELAGRPTITVHGFNLLSEKEGDRVSQLEQVWRAIFAAAGAGQVSLL
ncbi:hypothetical protein ACGFI3_18130 [Nonomuraea wenchangensis]|uniref:hypothetical protein n=1 Tax=Nonomuraea wenchangensis TaxID=568860 RepID=UPI003716475B